MEPMTEPAIDIVYDREPAFFDDGLPVFLTSEQAKALDEYEAENPYRTARTAATRWDEFRIGTVVEFAAGVVLDAGCGEGDLTERLRHRHQVAAFDCSISAVKRARDRLPAVRFAVADAADLPYAPDQFDTVIAANLFEHVESPCAMLRHAHSVLRSKGRLVISTPSRYRTRNFRRVLRGESIRFNHRHHVTEYTNGQVEELLARCGFTLTDVKTNLTCGTIIGTIAAKTMQATADLLGAHVKFGDPTVYVSRRE
jgi:2-polyprenyl-3-methyl-5-hydroxy-6-metoxy-1,4-benzoquinol methylase